VRIAKTTIKEKSMGLFKNMKGAMDMAGGAMAQAGQVQQQYGAPGGGGVAQMAADRASLQAQAHEFNRILTVGGPASAVIRSHVDAGEQVAGNPVWIFDLQVTPTGAEAYTVQHREIVSTAAMGAYPDGAEMACRIDPADPQKIAFGEKPFMQ
jgi:hypothetical protein